MMYASDCSRLCKWLKPCCHDSWSGSQSLPNAFQSGVNVAPTAGSGERPCWLKRIPDYGWLAFETNG